MVKLMLIFLSSLFSSLIYACEITDISNDEMVATRQVLINNFNNPGFRIAFNGIKEANNSYGLGGVNSGIEGYEKNLCEKLNSDEYKKKFPKAKYSIVKSDFKGYYVNCTPESVCQQIMQDLDKTLPPPLFKDEFGNLTEAQDFKVISAFSKNYQEGYIKARAVATYGDIEEPFHEFIDKQMREGILEATRNKMGFEYNINDTLLRRELTKNIETFRSEGVEKVNPRFKKLILALDSLLETPYANSNNIEKELSQALDANGSNGKKTISTAKTGDDLFLIIKDGDQVEKIVGADARGLGVMNMLTRLDAYQRVSPSSSDKKGLQSMGEVFKTSLKAMKIADSYMDKSMTIYEDILRKQILANPRLNIEENIAAAHEQYYELAKKDPQMMQIRAGAINDCGKNNKLIMNKITAIHNRLKIFEKAGIEKFFGMSCIGTEYWLRKAGLK